MNTSSAPQGLWLSAPVHSNSVVADVHWVQNQRQDIHARMQALSEEVTRNAARWPGLDWINVDIWATDEACVSAREMSLRKGELLARVSIDGNRIAKLDAAMRLQVLEIVLLQTLVSACARFELDDDLFRNRLSSLLAQTPMEDPTAFGLPRPLSADEVRRARSRKPKAKPAPKLIKLVPDDHLAKYVGKAVDGSQFFLTHPFVPAINGASGSEFIALYRFDGAGALIEARIEDFGPRAQLDDARVDKTTGQWLESLGKVRLSTIKVAPFSVSRFGQEFGLIPREPDFEGEDWAVTVEPGDYMSFNPPWNGDYDT